MRGLYKGISLLALTLALGGCFSTGGGSSTAFVPTAPVVEPPPPPPPEPEPEPEPVYERFTKISEMKRDANTKLVGVGQEVAISAFGPTEVEEAGDSQPIDVDFHVDGAGQADGFTVYGPATTRTWDIDSSTGTGLDQTSTNRGLYGEDSVYALSTLNAGYEYQSFGAWSTGLGTDHGTVGAFSVGAASDIASVPTSSSAVFLGRALGNYVDKDGKQFVTAADARLESDFADKIVYFETSNSKLAEVGTPNVVDDRLFDMAGSMTYTDSNALSGKVAAKNGMSGTLDGQFYGPGAQEIGGVFVLDGRDRGDTPLTETFTGSFGAKR